MSSNIQTQVQTQNQSLIFEPQNLTAETLRKYICPKATQDELMFFLQVCKSANINPLPIKRQIHFIKYGTQPAQIVVGYEVYLQRAEASGKLKGIKSWTEGSVKDGTLKGCVEIYRKDWDMPLYHEAKYVEFVRRTKEGAITNFWREKPCCMIEKTALSQALRWAFPTEIGSLPYTVEEMVDEKDFLEGVVYKQVDSNNTTQSMQSVTNNKNDDVQPSSLNIQLCEHYKKMISIAKNYPSLEAAINDIKMSKSEFTTLQLKNLRELSRHKKKELNDNNIENTTIIKSSNSNGEQISIEGTEQHEHTS